MINSTLANWETNDLLNSRIHILREAIQAHNYGMYHSSVTLFLSQIEGFLFEVTNFTGWAKQEKVNYILGDEENFHMYAEALRRFADVFLYEHFSWGNEYSSNLSRNAILHGQNLTYGTKVNSLRLFMFFHVIQSAFVREKHKGS